MGPFHTLLSKENDNCHLPFLSTSRSPQPVYKPPAFTPAALYGAGRGSFAAPPGISRFLQERTRAQRGGREGRREDRQPQFESHFQPLAGSTPSLPHHNNLDIILEESQARNPKAARRRRGRRKGWRGGQGMQPLCPRLRDICPGFGKRNDVGERGGEAAVVAPLKVISYDSE